MSNVKCGSGTIITALESVLLVAKDSELDEAVLDKAKEAFDFLEEKLSFTRMQSMVVSMLIDANSALDTGRMGGYLGIRNIRMLTYMQDIAALVNARVIRVSNDSYGNGYVINPKALAAYMNNRAFVPESDKNLCTRKLVQRMGEIMGQAEDGEITCEQMLEDITGLMKSNKNHFLCKRTKGLEPCEAALFFFCLDKYVGEGDLNICDHEFSSIFSRSDFIHRNGIRAHGAQNRINSLAFTASGNDIRSSTFRAALGKQFTSLVHNRHCFPGGSLFDQIPKQSRLSTSGASHDQNIASQVLQRCRNTWKVPCNANIERAKAAKTCHASLLLDRLPANTDPVTTRSRYIATGSRFRCPGRIAASRIDYKT
jgi:hypothetical protein